MQDIILNFKILRKICSKNSFIIINEGFFLLLNTSRIDKCNFFLEVSIQTNNKNRFKYFSIYISLFNLS